MQAQPARSSSAVPEMRLPSSLFSGFVSTARSPTETSASASSRLRPTSTACSETGGIFSPSPLARCGGSVQTMPVSVSLPYTVTVLPGIVRQSTPPTFVTRRKPFSSIFVTTRPIWSMCASSRMRRFAFLSPSTPVTPPSASTSTASQNESACAAARYASSSQPGVPCAAHSARVSRSISSYISLHPASALRKPSLSY